MRCCGAQVRQPCWRSPRRLLAADQVPVRKRSHSLTRRGRPCFGTRIALGRPGAHLQGLGRWMVMLIVVGWASLSVGGLRVRWTRWHHCGATVEGFHALLWTVTAVDAWRLTGWVRRWIKWYGARRAGACGSCSYAESHRRLVPSLCWGYPIGPGCPSATMGLSSSTGRAVRLL